MLKDVMLSGHRSPNITNETNKHNGMAVLNLGGVHFQSNPCRVPD